MGSDSLRAWATILLTGGKKEAQLAPLQGAAPEGAGTESVLIRLTVPQRLNQCFLRASEHVVGVGEEGIALGLGARRPRARRPASPGDPPSPAPSATSIMAMAAPRSAIIPAAPRSSTRKDNGPLAASCHGCPKASGDSHGASAPVQRDAGTGGSPPKASHCASPTLQRFSRVPVRKVVPSPRYPGSASAEGLTPRAAPASSAPRARSVSCRLAVPSSGHTAQAPASKASQGRLPAPVSRVSGRSQTQFSDTT